MILSQESIDALNSHVQLLFDKNIPFTIVFIYYHFTKITKTYNALSQWINEIQEILVRGNVIDENFV